MVQFRVITEPYHSDAYFKGVGLSLIVCVDLYVYELSFMTNRGYCAESSGKQSVAR
jgi:hypothetical protein